MTPTPTPTPILVELISNAPAASWFTLLLPGIFILSGALVGALITFLSTWRSDASKAKREDAVRWHEILRMECVKLIGLTGEASQLSREIHASRQAKGRPDASDEQIQKAIDDGDTGIQLMKDIMSVKSSILLLATAELASKANKVSSTAWELLTHYSEERNAALSVQMDDFLNAARTVLRVKLR